MSKLRHTLVAALLLSTASYAAAPPAPRSDPLKGVVLGDDVVTCVLVKRYAVDAYVHSLEKDRKASGRLCALANRSPLRWQIGRGAFWVSHDWNPGVPGPPDVGGGYLDRIDLAVFSKAEKIFNRPDANFSGRTPAARLAGLLHFSR